MRSAQSYTFHENVRAMIARGEDPQAEIVTRGHELGMEVYASVRMNDNHFGGRSRPICRPCGTTN